MQQPWWFNAAYPLTVLAADPAPFNGVDVLMLVFAVIAAMAAIWAAVSAHSSAGSSGRSATAAENSAAEARKANDLAERPDVSFTLGNAPDINSALGITFRSDTALKWIRITKVETYINGRAMITGEWKPSFVAQRSVGTSENYGNTLVFSDVKINHPLFVTWIPWFGHEGRRFELRIDMAIECIGHDGREWSMPKTLEHTMPGARSI